jgi:REP element-mobilizing transposase RayT
VTLFRDRYRIESARLPGWDYASAGCYFVTICTRDRVCSLGEVVDGMVRLSAAGEIAERYWKDIPSHMPGIGLDEFVIMPNHVHGVVILHDTDNHRNVCNTRRDVACYVSTQTMQPQTISPAAGSLSTAIRSFKAAVTSWCRENNHPFAWQPRFHDRIIRDEKTLAAARTYIRNNPAQWELDRDHPIRA